MSALETIKATLAQNGGDHLGDIVYWTLAETRIERNHLERIWASAQLDLAHLPEPPTAEKALKAAVREAAVGQPDRLVRLGKEDEAEVVLHRRARDETQRRQRQLRAGDPVEGPRGAVPGRPRCTGQDLDTTLNTLAANVESLLNQRAA